MPFDGIEQSQVTDALLAVRERLQRGWCQGVARRRWRGRDEYCLVGAVMADDDFRTMSLRPSIFRLLRLAMNDLDYEDCLRFTWLNDQHTKAEVLAVVDRAIAISRVES